MSDKLPTSGNNQQIDRSVLSTQAEVDIDLADPHLELDLDYSVDESGASQVDDNNINDFNDFNDFENDDINDIDDGIDLDDELLRPGDDDPLKAEVALALFEVTLSQVRQRELERQASSSLWLSHHWPQDYAEKCVKIGRRQICRRCAALYPLGFLTALLSVIGLPLWPATLDPMMIWILCIPATIAFVGEAIGLFKYSRRWQVATMLIAALAFGKALGYELENRWSPEFWWPIAIFGGTWFLASVFSAKTAPVRRTR